MPDNNARLNNPKSIPWNGIIGHVTLDGEPVTYFGVTIFRSSGDIFGTSDGSRAANLAQQLTIPKEPVVVHSASGRFAIEAKPGRWDIILAGPGFARRVVSGVMVGSSVGVTLEMEVSVGRTVNGTVIDKYGVPVAGASVAIIQTESCRTTDLLGSLACGNYSTVSKSDGTFQIDNFVDVETRVGVEHYTTPNIAASVTADGRMSFPLRIEDNNEPVGLVVFKTGTIDGSLVGSFSNESFLVVAQSMIDPAWRIVVKSATDGTFRFDRIPEGEYGIGAVRLNMPRPARLADRVTVRAGRTIPLALTLPSP